MGQPEPDPSTDATATAASGTVVSVNLEQIAFDGPAIIMIETETGAQQEIQVSSFGLLLCPAQESIADVYTLQSGDEVEVRGAVSAEGAIVPCESEDHYLRVSAE